MEDLSRHKAPLIGHKIQAKFENYCISRSGHRFKITQPNLMIILFCGRCFSLKMSKNMTLLARKVLKIRRSAFLGTPGIMRRENVTLGSPWKRDIS